MFKNNVIFWINGISWNIGSRRRILWLGFLVDDTISEKDLGIKELGSEDKDEEMSAQILEIVDNLFCKSTCLESVLVLAEVERHLSQL